jgi:hypothetical protein
MPLKRVDPSKALPAPAITSPELAKASTHPVRVRIMAALTMQTASPSELVSQVHAPVNMVSYHIKELVKLGCVEHVRSESVNSGRNEKHFYRSVVRPYMSLDAWGGLSDREKYRWANTVMTLITEDIARAQSMGTFLDPDDNHISRSPMVVDRRGWEESADILSRAVEELIEVQKRSALRLKGSPEEDEIFQKVEIIHFRSPDRV